MITTDLIQTTYLFTLLQLFLGQRHYGCLASLNTLDHHHHHHHSHHHHHHRQGVNPQVLLKSSLKFFDPSADHQRQIGKGESYQLQFESMGKTFFDQWDFFSDADPTHGLVKYQASAEEAWQNGLIRLQPSSLDKNFTSAIMKVDDSTSLSEGNPRNSVRISSKKAFKYGLVILDVIKIPFGCSVWPAFWTVGDNWPSGGEIDIVEGMNMGSVNQMTVHSVAGCKIKEKMSNQASGKVLHTNCDVSGSENLGCGVADPSISSLGKAFNDNGGGVFVMEWKDCGISVWRFNRYQIPEELIQGKNPRPANWTTPPIARWDHDDCKLLNEGFSPHKIIFDITLCGDWAGSPSVYNANGLCSGSCSSAVTNSSNFKDAYWEVASVKLYQ